MTNFLQLVIFIIISIIVLHTLHRVEQIHDAGFEQIRQQQSQIRTLELEVKILEMHSGLAAKDIIAGVTK